MLKVETSIKPDGNDFDVTQIENLKRVKVRDGICVSNSFYVVF